MRIDQNVLQQKQLISEAKQLLNSGDLTLKDGQSIDVKVLSRNGDTVTVKTDDGQIIKGRIEGDVPLSEGDKVTLVVKGNTDGVVLLEVSQGDDLFEGGASRPELNGSESTIPREDAHLAGVLESLRLPVTAENIVRMKQIIRDFPGTNLEQSAFFAANNIPAEANLMAAADAALRGAIDISDLLSELLELLPWEEAVAESAAALEGEAPEEGSLQHPGGDAGVDRSVQPQQPNAGWLSLIEGTRDGEIDIVPNRYGDKADILDIAAGEEAPPEIGGNATEAVHVTGGKINRGPVSAEEKLSAVLAKMPALKDIKEKGLADISQMLIGAAEEFKAPEGGGHKPLAEIIENFFIKLEGGADGAQELKKTKESLLAKLELLKDYAVRSQSDLPGRAEVISQTERLISHIKLVDSIEQFVYMQLPVTINSEQKAAQLYVFKQKKGNGKIDPDNIKVLLALDFQYMGHMESMIDIRGQEVTLRIEIESEKVGEFLRENTVDLHGALSESGFRLTDAKVSLLKERVNPENALQKFFRYESSIRSGINFTI